MNYSPFGSSRTYKRRLNRQLLLSMRLTFILLTFALSAMSADGISQNISINVKEVSLKKFLGIIRQKTGYGYAIGNMAEGLVGSSTITVSATNTPLKEVLDRAFRDLPVTYEVVPEDKYISIRRKDNVPGQLGIPVPALMDISGKILNSEGRPIEGVTVLERLSKRMTLSDQNGDFLLREVNGSGTLVLSSIGYETQYIPINNTASFTIRLATATQGLEEAVVMGYGTTNQKYNTGNITKVKGEDLVKQPITNPIQALTGRVAGVNISSVNGLPGAEVTVQIRGINSLAGGTAPLYVVDGVPFTSTALTINGASNGAIGNISPFNSLNSADIESIEVLKDADATAIYGSRGANGVILITTKKGKAGKTVFNANVYNGWTHVSKILQYLDTKQYLQLRKEAFANDGVSPNSATAPDLTIWDTTQFINYPKMFLDKTSHVTDVQVSVSGGSAKTSFLIGGNYRKEGIIYPGNQSYQRAGGHLNIDHTSNDNKFHLISSINYTMDKNNVLAFDVGKILYSPNTPIYDSTGKYYFYLSSNPVAYFEQSSKNNTDNLLTNVMLTYKVAYGLTLKVSAGYGKISLNQILKAPRSSLQPGALNYARYANGSSSSYIVEPQAEYNSVIKQGKLQVVAGSSWQNKIDQGNFIQGENYSNDALLESISAAGQINTLQYPKSNTYSDYKFASVFGRINYNWDSKYIINASYRRDGSSRFASEKKWGNFWAIGGAWIISNEPFVKDKLSVLSFGKLRGSYGVVGNDQIANYQYLSTYSSSGTYQNISGLGPSRIANPNYSWETSKKLEFGIDLGFLKDRIDLNITWYQTRSSNQLISAILPSQTGFTSYQANLPALVQNKGWEFLLNSTNIKSKNLTWVSNFNISFNENRLIEYPGLESAPAAIKNKYVVGKSLSIRKGYHFTGIDPSTGIAQYLDVNKDGSLNSTDDYVVNGDALPQYYGGLSNVFQYKGFQLDFLVTFTKRMGLKPFYNIGDINNIPSEFYDNRWRKPGDITNVPGATAYYGTAERSNGMTNIKFSDYVWDDASFIRLKNLSVSYSIPVKQLNLRHINKLRFFALVQNLLTLTNYKGIDPENPSQTPTVPSLKTFALGIEINL